MEPISLKPEKSSPEMSHPLGGAGCPVVYLEGPKALADLPEEGVITFKFERREVTVSANKKAPVRVVLKLLSIEDAKEAEVEAEDDAAEEMDSGVALDKLLSAEGEDEEVED